MTVLCCVQSTYSLSIITCLSSEYFNDCPVLRVPGRVFPVDIYHSKIRQIMTAKGPSNSSYVEVIILLYFMFLYDYLYVEVTSLLLC
jgi:hypothetical protein